MTTELLPCPFCGADAAFETVLDGEPGKEQRWYACNECYASTRPAITPEESRAAWNRRASVAAPPREPTVDMICAGADALAHDLSISEIWRAMYDASPAERVEGKEE